MENQIALNLKEHCSVIPIKSVNKLIKVICTTNYNYLMNWIKMLLFYKLNNKIILESVIT